MFRQQAPRSLIALTLCGALACSGGTQSTPNSSHPDASTASDAEAKTLALAVDQPFAELSVPPHSRPHGEEAPTKIPLNDWSEGKAGMFTAPNPIRSRNLYFFKPSPGMRIETASGEEIPHKYVAADTTRYWTYDRETVRLHGWDAAPASDDLFMVYAKATERERALNQVTSGATSESFVKTTVQNGNESRSGLLLPAPAQASWDLVIPPAAEMRFHSMLIAPEIADGPPSDGATLTMTWTSTEQPQEWVYELKNHNDTFHSIDLSELEGQEGRLTFTTTPGGDNRFDYVFVADPVIASRKANPRRVVMVFVDTLRADHVSTFGYKRDTTPALDAMAARGAAFSQARNVAPWTLPSTRSVLTGQDPELYFSSDTLQGRLRNAGFSTAMFAGNLYLGANFGLNRDWGLHYVELLPRAERQLDRALEWLDDNRGRDAFMLLHLMDPHLPYEEPKEYRRLYAGDAPSKLPKDVFHRPGVLNAKLRTQEERQYIRDRYDNNIRYADDQLARLYERLDDNDILVFFSDHGEEFWDHGGFEHGHTLYDELLRVPLVIKGPGIPKAKIDAPVSLLDVTPTVLDLLGLPHEGFKGRSLVELANGDSDVRAEFMARPQAFGRPLYGHERWGVLASDMKYTTVAGRDELFNLEEDAAEKKNLRDERKAEVEQLRGILGHTLGRDVAVSFRLAARGVRKAPQGDFVATVTLPSGIASAWVGEDPTSSSAATVQVSEDRKSAVLTWPKGFRGSRNVWLVPEAPMVEATGELRVDLKHDGETDTVTIDPAKPRYPTGKRLLLAQGKAGSRGFEIGFGYAPKPLEGSVALSGYDAELAEQLKAMGYAVGDDE